MPKSSIVENLYKYLAALAGIVAIIYGTMTYFATAGDLNKTNYRLEQKINLDRAEKLEERIWKLEDRYEKTKDAALLDVIRDLKQEKKQIEEETKKAK